MARKQMPSYFDLPTRSIRPGLKRTRSEAGLGNEHEDGSTVASASETESEEDDENESGQEELSKPANFPHAPLPRSKYCSLCEEERYRSTHYHVDLYLFRHIKEK